MLVCKEPLCYLIMATKLKSSDAGNSATPKRSYKVFLVSEKVQVLHLVRKERKMKIIPGLLRSIVRTNLLPVKS